MTSNYASFARGAHAEANEEVDYTDFDFGVAVGKNITTCYLGPNLEAMDDLHIPGYAMFAVNPYDYVNFNSGNMNSWPDAEHDPTMPFIMEALEDEPFSGIILDCSQYKSGSIYINGMWIKLVGTRVLDLLATKYPDKEILMYSTTGAIDYWRSVGSQGDIAQLETFYQNQGDKAALRSKTSATLDGLYPATGQRPAYTYDDTSIVKWKLWLYSVNTLPWKWLSNTTKDALYTRLGFVGGTVTPPPDEGDPPVVVPPTGDLAEALTILRALKAKADKYPG